MSTHGVKYIALVEGRALLQLPPGQHPCPFTCEMEAQGLKWLEEQPLDNDPQVDRNRVYDLLPLLY